MALRVTIVLLAAVAITMLVGVVLVLQIGSPY
jgi:hypothetical protein